MNPELLDIMAGRHCCRCHNWEFPRDMQSVRMNAFAIEGKVMWEVWMHKHFWSEVGPGNIGLDPVKLFRREYVN
jgi:hypothetical protein